MMSRESGCTYVRWVTVSQLRPCQCIGLSWVGSALCALLRSHSAPLCPPVRIDMSRVVGVPLRTRQSPSFVDLRVTTLWRLGNIGQWTATAYFVWCEAWFVFCTINVLYCWYLCFLSSLLYLSEDYHVTSDSNIYFLSPSFISKRKGVGKRLVSLLNYSS